LSIGLRPIDAVTALLIAHRCAQLSTSTRAHEPVSLNELGAERRSSGCAVHNNSHISTSKCNYSNDL
jgi:hypothetical protein